MLAVFDSGPVAAASVSDAVANKGLNAWLWRFRLRIQKRLFNRRKKVSSNSNSLLNTQYLPLLARSGVVNQIRTEPLVWQSRT